MSRLDASTRRRQWPCTASQTSNYGSLLLLHTPDHISRCQRCSKTPCTLRPPQSFRAAMRIQPHLAAGTCRLVTVSASIAIMMQLSKLAAPQMFPDSIQRSIFWYDPHLLTDVLPRPVFSSNAGPPTARQTANMPQKVNLSNPPVVRFGNFGDQRCAITPDATDRRTAPPRVFRLCHNKS